ncbi:aldolase/citrate lyase family protein, partial [Salmonella enterica]|uniref:aldolase/citrate lyase family protein n=1 Tax=Salmonella enterica TaxID=28901 RepID=UPI000A86C02D
SGYDCLLMDGGTALNTGQALYHQFQAIPPHASQPVIRPIEGSKALINQVRNSGAQPLLTPMVDPAEQARQVVPAPRYPPLGQR